MQIFLVQLYRCIRDIHKCVCVFVCLWNLSNIGLPALVLLRSCIFLKRNCLVGCSNQAAPVVDEVDCCADGCHGTVVMLRHRDPWYLGRETGYGGAGVSPVTWTHMRLKEKYYIVRTKMKWLFLCSRVPAWMLSRANTFAQLQTNFVLNKLTIFHPHDIINYTIRKCNIF